MTVREAEARGARAVARGARMALAFTALIGAVLVECGGVWLLHHGTGIMTALGLAAGHLAAAGLSAEGLALRSPPASGAGGDGGLFRTGWLLGLAFPIFGPPAALLVGLIFPRTDRPMRFTASMEALRHQAAQAALERRREQQQLGRSLDAIVDALKDRDPKLRLAAVDALARERSPRASKLLADARENSVFDVRVRAVQALARIAKEHGDRLAEAKKALAAEPRALSRHAEVAALVFEYARLGVEDSRMVRHLLAEARAHAEAAVALGDESPRTLNLLGGALNALGLHEEAEAVFRRRLLAGPHDHEALLGVAEAQFARRAFGLLPLTSRWVLQQAGPNLEREAVASLRFWVRDRRGGPG